MSIPGRPMPSHLRHPSLPASGSGAGASAGNSTHSPVLVARIAEKKVELDSLRELRDLSAQMASQMQMLEEKLSTLSSGTEAVAVVLSNWHNVLRAINMASMKIPGAQQSSEHGDDDRRGENEDVRLPQTLVRIPVQQQQTAPTSGDQE